MEEKNVEWGIPMDRIKLLVGLSNYVYDYVNLVVPNYSDRQYIEGLLEEPNGMKDLVKDMYDNADKRFIDLYKKLFVDKLALNRTGRCPNSLPNRFSSFSNLYAFFKAYKLNKDDYDNFNVIVNDLMPSVSNPNPIVFSKERKILIDLVLGNKNYKDLPELRKFFNTILKVSDGELTKSFGYYKSILVSINDILFNRPKYLRVTEDEEKNRLKVANEIIKRALTRRDNNHKVGLFYDDLLLYGNRFSYLNDKLVEIEDNFSIRKEIFGKIASLSNGMFAELNKLDSHIDSFISCMNIVFASDTYTEVLNKLSALEKASFDFESGQKKQAFEVIKGLGNLDYKETINGEIIMYVGTSYKPKKIIDRMKELYGLVDEEKTPEVITNAHKNAKNISFVYFRIGEFKKKEIKEDPKEEMALGGMVEDEYDDYVGFDFSGCFDKFQKVKSIFSGLIKKDK